jgi:hypothetical protein
MDKALRIKPLLFVPFPGHSRFLNTRTENAIQVHDDIEPPWNILRQHCIDHVAPLGDFVYLEIMRQEKRLLPSKIQTHAMETT